jgi:integrase
MRGSLKQRSKGSWSLILDLGYQLDPVTGLKKRQQRWHTFRGTRKDAEGKLTDLLKEVGGGTYVDASKITVGQWLTEWLTASKKKFRESTYDHYTSIIQKHLLHAPIASIGLQKLRSTHIEQYYANAILSDATLMVHHAILHQALRKAKKDALIASNPAVDLDHRPRRPREKASEGAQQHVWTATEARRFLAAAKAAGAQPAAIYALALDSGARKAELCGLTWDHLDLDAAQMHIVQQLLRPKKDAPPARSMFGLTKTGRPRTVALAEDTVALLRAHRKHQRELMMANRKTYHDHGLVCAKEWSDVRRRGECLGQPLQMNNLGQREYATLIKTADVKPIKFHGMRHPCATLLLKSKQPVHVVSERLGHARVSQTMETYAHVLPDMQTEAAATLGALLHG